MTFSDSGAGVNSDITDTDSFGLTNYAQTTYSTYHVTGGTAGPDSYTVTGSQLAKQRGSLLYHHQPWLSEPSQRFLYLTGQRICRCQPFVSVTFCGFAFTGFFKRDNVLQCNRCQQRDQHYADAGNHRTTATVKVNGASVTSGSASGAIPLSEGSNTINVTVTAADGTSTSGFSVQVQRNGLAPVAGSAGASVAFNSSNNAIALPLSGGAATSVVSESAPAHGSVVFSGSTALYTPLQNYFGPDSFTYTASNTWGTSHLRPSA